jgi:hypothetical protein
MIGVGISGAFSILLWLIKLYLEFRARQSLNKYLQEKCNPSSTDKETQQFVQDCLRPITQKIMTRIQTTGFLGYRSSKETERYVEAIELILAEIHKNGVSLNFRKMIVESFDIYLGKNHSLCSCGRLRSLFRPDATPAQFKEKMQDIVQNVKKKHQLTSYDSITIDNVQTQNGGSVNPLLQMEDQESLQRLSIADHQEHQRHQSSGSLIEMHNSSYDYSP